MIQDKDNYFTSVCLAFVFVCHSVILFKCRTI